MPVPIILPGKGWDIEEFVNQELDPICGTGGCAHTVKIQGKCYGKDAANYFMWGLINSLCDNWKADVWLGLQWSRLISGNYECKKAWAYAGYEERTEGVSCPQYNQCNTNQCTKSISKLTPLWRMEPVD